MREDTLFSGKAGAYAAARPAYAEAALDLIAALVPAGTAADVGAGTGIFSRQLALRGYEVYAVEPNGEMRGRAAELLAPFPRVKVLAGRDTDTGLPDGSADLVAAAQAFHWFDGPGFRRECRRILRGEGRVFLLWNDRAPGWEFDEAWAAVSRRFCPGFTGFSGGLREDDEKIAAFFENGYQKSVFQNPMTWSREQFLSRARSSSYALAETDPGYREWQKALAAAFDEAAPEGVLRVPQRTVLYYGTM